MRAQGLADVLTSFAEPEARPDAASALARWLGTDAVFFMVTDPELGALQPAPGLPQTVQGGSAWRAFVKTCSASVGELTADVDYPVRDARTRATAHVTPNGTALFMFGGEPDAAKLAELVTALPLLGAMFRGELAACLARGEAEVARATGQHANNLAVALDAARGEVERALAESARLNAELQDTDRRKDDFLAMLGHELRNPMAAISGAVEVMRASPHDRAQTARARAVIERQIEQLARLVDDLLDVARITRGKISLRREVLDVEEAVRRAVEATHPLAAAKRHTVKVEVRERVAADADRTRLEQMISNLLTNAAKYTDPDGHITVVVDRDGSDATVSVTDDGIGVPPAMLPRIFEAFLQVEPSLDRSAGGLGVGLTVVSRLAALHGGRVDATSELGKGSTFTVRLPAVAAATLSSPPAPVLVVSTSKKKVLVVDDNADSAEMMVMLIETWGHEAFRAADGRAAIAMAHEVEPNVVLLDIGLPGMDGYEVAAKLRTDPRTRGARIVAVSGYGQDADRVKSRAAGCDEHLVKPVDLHELERVLGSA